MDNEITKNFIENIIDEDNEKNTYGKRIHTRFPPEPNGYLHIGHAKSICLNFGIAKKYGGITNLRFDDTNPSKEDVEYVNSIKEDVQWLGFTWDDRMFYASDYFDTLYNYAVKLIKLGKATSTICQAMKSANTAVPSARRARKARTAAAASKKT